MSSDSLDRAIEQSHVALSQIVNGNSGGYDRLLSRQEDVTLGNPFGPFVRGRQRAVETAAAAARRYRDGEIVGFDLIASYVTDDLACVVEVERFRAKVGGSADLASIGLRVTSIFRPEDGTWKLVHRHADPITTPQPTESVVPTRAAEVMEAIRTTGACRYFKPDPVSDEVLGRLLDAARHGPQGGNRQPLRYIVVRDPPVKKQLREWYLRCWKAHLERGYRAGDSAESGGASKVIRDADHLANHLDDVPVLIVVCAVLSDLVLPDTKLDRPSVAGGASIYPSVQNLLLAARHEGLGATLTTILCEVEADVRELLGIPAELITCATLAIGYPDRPLPTRLTRAPVSEIAFSERYGEPLFTT